MSVRRRERFEIAGSFGRLFSSVNHDIEDILFLANVATPAFHNWLEQKRQEVEREVKIILAVYDNEVVNESSAPTADELIKDLLEDEPVAYSDLDRAVEWGYIQTRVEPGKGSIYGMTEKGVALAERLLDIQKKHKNSIAKALEA
jgi:hypothetical protein